MIMKKYHTVFLMVRAIAESDFEQIGDTVHEIETDSKVILPDTPKVKILETEILLTRVRNVKNINHGTRS